MGARNPHLSWQDLLRTPERPTHIVQLCESDEALAAGAAFFAAEGLDKGEAVVLTGTQPHFALIRGALRARGVDVDAALRREQLVYTDADAAVAAVMVDGLPDRGRFMDIAGEVLGRVGADPRYRGVRWWGEMSNVFNRLGNRAAVLLDEEIGDEICRKHGVSLMCSFQCERFDPASYHAGLFDVCSRHSHVIPAEDYAGHRLAVNRAIADVLGELDGRSLESLLSWEAPACDLPSSQALLFWLWQAMPGVFPKVLERCRAHQAGVA